MQVKLLQGLVEELAGMNSGEIVEILFNKREVNEFLIAKKMGLTINQVRNILYKLSAEGLVTFIRKKDKKKGWYIYYWTLDSEKCLKRLEQAIMRKIDELNSLLKNRQLKRYYVCKECNIEVGEETALEHGFTCEECAEVYELSEHEKPIKEIKSRITRTHRDLKIIQQEIEKVKTKTEKKKKREVRREEKAKKKFQKKIVKKKTTGKGKKKIKKPARLPKKKKTKGKKK